MNYLLDTHTFLWLSSTPQKVSPSALAVCNDPAHQLYLSLISIWEIQIKLQLGKLSVPQTLPILVKTMQKANDLRILPLNLKHIWNLGQLPHHHRDPFDRLLIAQTLTHNFTLISHDALMVQYPISVLW